MTGRLWDETCLSGFLLVFSQLMLVWILVSININEAF